MPRMHIHMHRRAALLVGSICIDERPYWSACSLLRAPGFCARSPQMAPSQGA